MERDIDLSPWSGQTVTLTFATSPGPNGNDRYDWAGWGELRLVQPIAYDFLDHFSEAKLTAAGLGQAYTKTETIDKDTRLLLYQHPTSQVSYTLTLPPQSTLAFGLGMAPEVWLTEGGDGTEYNIYIRRLDQPHKPHLVFHQYLDPKNTPDDRRWFDHSVNLSRFGGQQVDVVFEALPGPAGDENYDWGGWSAPVLVEDTGSGEISIGSTEDP
jgi:hypothetical protein